jgi:O-antigen/teichoic acid export membrane protein
MSYKMSLFTILYNKVKNSYFCQNGFWVTLAFCFDNAFALAFQLLLINFFSKEIYGNYQLCIALSGTVMAFSLSGVRVAVVNYSAQNKDWCLAEALKFQWKIIIALCFAHFGVAWFYFQQKNNVFLLIMLLILGFTSPLINILNTYSSFLQGKKEFKKLSLISLGINFGANFSSLVSIFFLRDPIISIATSQIVRVFMNGILTFRTMRTININSIQPETSERKVFRRQSLHFSFLSSMGSALLHIDKVVVDYFLGVSSVADLTIATGITSRIRSFLKNISTIQIPKLAGQSVIEIKKDFSKYIIMLTTMDFLCVLFTYLASPYIVRFIFPNYADTTGLVQLASGELIFLMLNGYLGGILKAKAQLRSLYPIVISQYTIKLFLYIILTKYFGITGTIISRILAIIFGTGIISIYVWRYLSIETKKLEKNKTINQPH